MKTLLVLLARYCAFSLFVFTTPIVAVVLFFQLKSVHYTLLFLSWYIKNPTYDQSNLISSVRVLDTSIFGGMRWAAGLNIYDFTFDPQVNNPYIYPPLLAFIGYYFSTVSYAVSHLVWIGTIAASFYLFLLLGGWYLYRQTKRVWLTISFFGIGALSQLILGQINYGHYFLLLVPITFGIYITKNWMVAAILEGLGLGISLYAVFLLPFLLIKNGLRASLLALATGLLLQFPFLFNWASAEAYPRYLLKLNGYFFDQPDSAFNFRDRLFHQSPLLDSLYILVILGLAAVVVANYIKNHHKTHDRLLSFMVTTSLMVDPLISDHHLPLLYIVYVLNFGRKSFFLLFPLLFIVNDFHIGLYNKDPWVSGVLLNHSLRFGVMVLTYIYTLTLVQPLIKPKSALLFAYQIIKKPRLLKTYFSI